MVDRNNAAELFIQQQRAAKLAREQAQEQQRAGSQAFPERREQLDRIPSPQPVDTTQPTTASVSVPGTVTQQVGPTLEQKQQELRRQALGGVDSTMMSRLELNNLRNFEQETGGNARSRMRQSLAITEALERRFMSEDFGAGNWYKDPDSGQMFIRVKTPLSPSGFTVVKFKEDEGTLKDLLDHTGTGVEITAGVLATMALSMMGTPLTGAAGAAGAASKSFSMREFLRQSAKLSAISAGASQGAGLGAQFTLTDVKPGELFEVMERRGVEAAVDFLFGMAADSLFVGAKHLKDSAQGSAFISTANKLLLGVENSIRAERSIAVNGAVERLRKSSEYLSGLDDEARGRLDSIFDRLITVGMQTQSPALQRGEAMSRFVPGMEQIRKEVMESDKAIRELQDFFVGDAGVADMADISRLIQQTVDSASDEVVNLRKLAMQKTEGSLEQLANKFGVTGVNKIELWSRPRSLMFEKRSKFFEDARIKYDTVRRAPGGMEKIVKFDQKETQKLLGELKKFTRSTTDDANVLKVTPEVDAFIKKAESLIENDLGMDITEGMLFRKQLFDDLDRFRANPDFNTAAISKAIDVVNDAFDKAVRGDTATELNKALQQANKFYRENAGLYKAQSVSGFFVPGDRPGWVNEETVVKRLTSSLETLKAYGSIAGDFEAIKPAVMDKFISKAYATGMQADQAINTAKFASEVNSFDPAIGEEIFGKKAWRDLVQTANTVKNSSRYLDSQAIRDVLGGVDTDAADLLRMASFKEQTLKLEFDNRFWKPMLRGELDPADIPVEGIVRHTLAAASVADVKKLAGILPPDQMKRMNRLVLAEMLEKSNSSVVASEILDGFATGSGRNVTRVSPGKLFDKMTKEYGANIESSKAKLKILLGDDLFVTMQDLMIVNAARSESLADGMQLAGSLAGGNMYMELFRGINPLRLNKSIPQALGAISDIGAIRIMSFLLTQEVTVPVIGKVSVRKFLTDQAHRVVTREAIKTKGVKLGKQFAQKVKMPPFHVPIAQAVLNSKDYQAWKKEHELTSPDVAAEIDLWLKQHRGDYRSIQEEMQAFQSEQEKTEKRAVEELRLGAGRGLR